MFVIAALNAISLRNANLRAGTQPSGLSIRSLGMGVDLTCHALVRCHLTVLHLLGFCSRAFGEVSMTTRLALGEFCQRDKHSATESPRPSKSKTTRVLPLRSALNIASARPGGLHGTGAARAARVSERPGCAIARNLRIARDMSDPHPRNTASATLGLPLICFNTTEIEINGSRKEI